MNDDDLRAKLTKALAENGVGPNGADMHSWRCSAYDDYCHCIPDLVGDLQAVVVEALAEAWDGGYRAANDDLTDSLLDPEPDHPRTPNPWREDQP